MSDNSKDTDLSAAEDARAQRRSYILAEAMMGTDDDEAAWKAASESGDYNAMHALQQDAQARVDRARRYLDRNGY